MDCSMPGFPICHQLLEFTQTHVHKLVMPSNYLILCHPFSSCLQSFPASGSFPMSQLFSSGVQSFGASASTSVLLMNIQDLFSLGLTGLISLLFKGHSRVFSNTTVWKHHFFGAQPSLWSNSLIHTLLLEKLYLWLWDLEWWLCSTGTAVRRYPTSKGREAPASKMVGTGLAAVQCWSDFEEIPPIQGQRRSPSKTVEGGKSCLESNPTPARDTQRAQTYLVHTRTQRPDRDWDRTVFECFLRRYRSAVDFHRGRGSGCSRPGYGIGPLGGGHH